MIGLLARFTDMIIRAAAANKPSVIAVMWWMWQRNLTSFTTSALCYRLNRSCVTRCLKLLLMPSDRYWLTDCGFLGIAAGRNEKFKVEQKKSLLVDGSDFLTTEIKR